MSLRVFDRDIDHRIFALDRFPCSLSAVNVHCHGKVRIAFVRAGGCSVNPLRCNRHFLVSLAIFKDHVLRLCIKEVLNRCSRLKINRHIHSAAAAAHAV